MEYKLDGVDYIGTDNYSGMHEIVEHLVQDHGLRDIAYISGPDDNYESRERGRAFLEVMRENNIEPKETGLFCMAIGLMNLHTVLQQIW